MKQIFLPFAVGILLGITLTLLTVGSHLRNVIQYERKRCAQEQEVSCLEMLGPNCFCDFNRVDRPKVQFNRLDVTQLIQLFQLSP